MINAINKVDLKIHTSQFDFLKQRDIAFNLELDKDKIESSVGFIESESPYGMSGNATQIKEFNNKVYISSKDGYLYYYDGDFYRVGDVKINSSFNLEYVDYQNNKTLMVGSTTNCYLATGGEPKVLPFKSSEFAYAFGRIFYNVGNYVYYTKPYDYFSEPDGAIKLEKPSGSFRKLYVIKDELFLLCSDKIFKIPAFSSHDDLKLITVLKEKTDILLNSVFCVGEDIFFLEGREMCKFNGKTIERFNTCINTSDYLLNVSGAGMYKGVINMRVALLDGVNKIRLYRYDTNTNTESIIDFNGTLFTWYSACMSSNGNLQILNESGNKNVIYQSSYCDFSIPNEKNFYSISCYVSHPIEVKIIGDFGEKKIYFKKGYNQIFCNFSSVGFKLAISAVLENFKLYDLKIKYTIKE